MRGAAINAFAPPENVPAGMRKGAAPPVCYNSRVDFFDAIIIAIVEGITEFLPISSTGHMIIAQKLLGIPATEFTKTFIVSIQFGAILSVVALYWKNFVQSLDFYWKLFVAFLPAAVAGFFLGDVIDAILESATVVAVSLILGGIVLLKIDDWLKPARQKEGSVTYGQAFRIGLFQVVAMIPGVSRSAATIIGGMSQGLTRKRAAEFSFFLAVPTMFGATAYQLFKHSLVFSRDDLVLLVVGNIVAFFVAALAIKTFIAYIATRDFRAFGWYRIAAGVLVLITLIPGD